MTPLPRQRKIFYLTKVKMDNFFKTKSYTQLGLIGLNIFVSIYLLLSYFAPYIDPKTFTVIAFLGLSYPIALIMNVVFMMSWLFMKSKWALLSSIIILVGIPIHLRLFSIGFEKTTIPKNANTLKVMSYNVQLFGYYNQTPTKANQTRNSIFNFIRLEDPDVLCIQEYFHQDGKEKFNTKDSIYSIMSINSHHEKSKYYPKKRTHFGIALFSKYPIINKGIVHHNGSQKDNLNYCIYADIVKKKDTLRVYNVHFQSIKLDTDEYSKKTNIDSDSQTKSKKFRSAISKLNKAFKIRSKQSETVSLHMKKSPYKTIICGDFNDTPISYTYQVFNQNMIDAFRNTSNGFGSTYIGYLPAGRIDYIFHSKSLNSALFKIQNEKLSDHFAISCTLF